MSVTFEVVNGRFANVKVNGKPVRKPIENLLNKAEDLRMPSVTEGNQMGVNPFSGVSVELNPLEFYVYDWCLWWYRLYNVGRNPCPVQTYDRMKYFLLDMNSTAYMDLLD
jgi:hypothetical protein